METKKNSAGEQQPMKPNGEYASFNNFHKPSKDEEIAQLENEIKTEKSLFTRIRLKHRLEFLKSDFETIEEFDAHKKMLDEEKKNELEKKSQLEAERKAKEKKLAEEQKKMQLEQDYKNAPQHKREQFDIIQKENPMLDDYHVGIRTPKDIKTFEETIEDEDSFNWGDFSREDAKRALKKGSIIVYSSYPIKNGVFISTSKSQAEQYAGGIGKKIYQQEIPLDKVAWINGDEGQFADTEKRVFNHFKK